MLLEAILDIGKLYDDEKIKTNDDVLLNRTSVQTIIHSIST